ncbi:MAG TPA: hypothetical protein ENJ31_12670 [Anaerolineae bacterium]|nr:hypothetical protein [Anaerolineae bacterium]
MATAVLDSLVETVGGLPEQDARAVLDFARSLLARVQRSSGDRSGTVAWENDPLWDIVGLGASGVSDGAVEHDKYLYGKDHSCKSAAYWQRHEQDAWAVRRTLGEPALGPVPRAKK